MKRARRHFRGAETARFVSAAFLVFVLAGACRARGETLTTVRRPLVVSKPVSGRVASIGGDVFVRARVGGDIVVWAADVHLEPGADVEGDVVDFGGSVSGPRESVRGRVVTPGSLTALYLSEARQVPWRRAGAASWPTSAGLRLFVLALWTLAASLVLRLWSSAVARTSIVFEDHPGIAAASGLVAIVFLFLAGVAAITALPAGARVLVAAIILAAAFSLKIFGMTALFVFIGQRVRNRYHAGWRPAALGLGIVLCGGVSLVPVAGPILWSAASVLAIGAALFTRFGSPRFRVAVPGEATL